MWCGELCYYAILAFSKQIYPFSQIYRSLILAINIDMKFNLKLEIQFPVINQTYFVIVILMLAPVRCANNEVFVCIIAT